MNYIAIPVRNNITVKGKIVNELQMHGGSYVAGVLLAVITLGYLFF